MDSDMGKCACCCCAICCCLTIVLIFMSFKTISSNTYSIKYNYITQSLGDDVYTSGLYFVGPGYEFITYPSSVQ